MSRKLNVPNVAGNVEGLPFGATVFLQSIHDALNILDNNVVYKDDISINIGTSKMRALTAQGQTFSVDGTNLASGDDYAALVANTRTILEDLNALRSEVNQLKNQIKGS